MQVFAIQAQAGLNRIACDKIKAGRFEIDKGWNLVTYNVTCHSWNKSEYEFTLPSVYVRTQPAGRLLQ
jgi:hypothetical protein